MLETVLVSGIIEVNKVRSVLSLWNIDASKQDYVTIDMWMNG
jgi:hypothetical protein